MPSWASAAKQQRKVEVKKKPPATKVKLAIHILIFVIGIPAVLALLVLGWLMAKDVYTGKIVSAGVSRRYLLYVPKTYERSRPTPLVISLHGAAGWPALQRDISHWNDLADRHGFLVVYPAGTTLIGERGPRVWPMGPESLDLDVKFISDLIENLNSNYNIDPERIYADGLSNGGGMAFALGCKLSNQVAAVGAVAAALSLPSKFCLDARPEPVIAFHGTADTMAPYLGGKSGDPVNPQEFPAIRDWLSDWALRNHCAGLPTDALVYPSVHRLTYSGCAHGADVVLYSIIDGGHQWPGGKALPAWWVGKQSKEINATRLMWDFYSRHPRTSR